MLAVVFRVTILFLPTCEQLYAVRVFETTYSDSNARAVIKLRAQTFFHFECTSKALSGFMYSVAKPALFQPKTAIRKL